MVRVVTVTLDEHEMLMGAACGIRRHIAALLDGRRDNHGFNGDGWGAHIEGSCGEIAAAKAMGRFWSQTCNTFKMPDLGAYLQVRTRSSDEYELIVRPSDSPEDLFVLVTGRAPIFVVRGWISGAEAQRSQWLADHGGRPPAYFVPHAALHDIRNLPLL